MVAEAIDPGWAAASGGCSGCAGGFMFDKFARIAGILTCCVSVWCGSAQAVPYISSDYLGPIEASGRNPTIRDHYTRRYQGLLTQNSVGALSDAAFVVSVINLSAEARAALFNATSPVGPISSKVEAARTGKVVVLTFDISDPELTEGHSELVRRLIENHSNIPGGFNTIASTSAYDCSYAQYGRLKACTDGVTSKIGFSRQARGSLIEQDVPSFLGDFTQTALAGKILFDGPLLVIVSTDQTYGVGRGGDAGPGDSFLDVQMRDPKTVGGVAFASLEAPIEDVPEPASLVVLASGLAAASLLRRRGLRC